MTWQPISEHDGNGRAVLLWLEDEGFAVKGCCRNETDSVEEHEAIHYRRKWI